MQSEDFALGWAAVRAGVAWTDRRQGMTLAEAAPAEDQRSVEPAADSLERYSIQLELQRTVRLLNANEYTMKRTNADEKRDDSSSRDAGETYRVVDALVWIARPCWNL